jgi:hypothetical protein
MFQRPMLFGTEKAIILGRRLHIVQSFSQILRKVLGLVILIEQAREGVEV